MTIVRYDEEKMVTRIAPTKVSANEYSVATLKRVAAYCRVSTDEEDQINSYEIQKRKYTDKILAEPGWRMVGIYADKGITGTSIANRDEFKRMIRHCKKGKIDMIITKSVSRVARNTLDTLTYTRSLRDLGIDVYFEEQNIHSIEPSSDFMISLYGSLAQSESESISENVKWGKRQSAKEGKVPFDCSRFLGYRKDKEGNIEIVPEEAEIIKLVFKLFIEGKTYGNIANYLNDQGITTKTGKKWYPKSIENILGNVKYKGDVLTNKTFRNSVTSKKIRQNTGEVEQFYISKHHPAIIDDITFARAHAEIERRYSLEKAFQKNTKTEKGRYNGKFVFNDILVCGDCGMPYRRCTWTSHGTHRVVWRCVKRVEYGKKYCHHSPTIYEDVLQSAVMRSIVVGSDDDAGLFDRIKDQIQNGSEECGNPVELQKLQNRLDRLTRQFDVMLNSVSNDDFDEVEFEKLSREKYEVTAEIDKIRSRELLKKSRVDLSEVYDALRVCGKCNLEFDKDIVRKSVKRIVVKGKHELEITFIDDRVMTCSV